MKLAVPLGNASLDDSGEAGKIETRPEQPPFSYVRTRAVTLETGYPVYF